MCRGKTLYKTNMQSTALFAIGRQNEVAEKRKEGKGQAGLGMIRKAHAGPDAGNEDGLAIAAD